MKKVILSSLVLIGLQAFAMPNPAATNCVRLGGKLKVVSTPEGQEGICSIEEWKLYNQMKERGLTRVHNYGNPAAVNCVEIGGERKTVGHNGICSVEEWTLFKAINILSER